MSKAKEQPKKREEEKQNRPLDPLLTHGLRRGMRGQMFNGLRDLRQLLKNRLTGIADLGRKADRDARALKAIPEGLRLSPSGFNGSRFGNRAWALSAASSSRSRPRTAIATSMSPGGAEGELCCGPLPRRPGALRVERA